MLSIALSAALFANVQDMPPPPARPMLECSEHLTEQRALNNCLDDLLDDAEDAMQSAAREAREEARDADAETGGMFSAADNLATAQIAWETYRDAECDRRASLMILGRDQREATALDCRIALTRSRTHELREE